MTDGAVGGGVNHAVGDVEEPALFGYDWMIENFPHTYEEFCHQPRRGPYTSDRIEIKANNIATSSTVAGSGKDDDTINNLYGIWKMRLVCRGQPEPLSGPSGTVPIIPNNPEARSDDAENDDDDDPDSSGGDENNDDAEETATRSRRNSGVASTKINPHKKRKHRHHRQHDPYPLLVTLRAMQLAEPVEAFVRLSLIDASEQMVYSTRVRTKPYRFKETVADATEFELRVTKEELFSMPSTSPVIADDLPKSSTANSPASSTASSRSGKQSTGSGSVSSSRGKRQNPVSSAVVPGTPYAGGVVAASSAAAASDELPTFPPPIRSIVDGSFLKPMKYFYRHRMLRIRLELQIHPGTLWSPLHDDMLKLFTDAEEQPDAEAAVIADFRVMVGKSSSSTTPCVGASPSVHGGGSSHGSGGGGLRSAPSAMRAHDLHSSKSGVSSSKTTLHHHPPTAANGKHSATDHHHVHFSSPSTNKLVKSFRCHRLILASRCPYFNAMLANKNIKFRETSRGEHHIVDVRPAVVRILLQFIYTDFTAVIGLDFDAAYELYSLAREYELNRLLELCKFRMVQCVNAENCLAAFRIGDLHDESVIKRVAIATVARQKHAVTQSTSWADIMHNEPALLGKMLVEMAPMVGSLFSGPGSGVANNYYHTSSTTNGFIARSSSIVIDPFSLQQSHGSGASSSQHQTLLASTAPVSSAILTNHNMSNAAMPSASTKHSQKLDETSTAVLSSAAGPSTSSTPSPSQPSTRGGRRNTNNPNKKRKLN